jgi:hypothetical protein
VKKIIKIKNLPNSLINNGFDNPDYSDFYRILINNKENLTIDYLAAKFFLCFPFWVKFLLRTRNFIVGFFGLQGGSLKKLQLPEKTVYYPVGSKVILFSVINRNEDEILMGEEDKHLNFFTSVILEKLPNSNKAYLYSSTTVKYNNFAGRFYFFFVKPFHKLIIKTQLKILAKEIGL